MKIDEDGYIERLSDKLLEDTLNSMGAVSISGPKGCGKSTSASRLAKTIIDFQDLDNGAYYIATSKSKISELFTGETPILFDEWQDGEGVWDAVRNFVDKKHEKGLCLLTGSVNEKGKMSHSGYARIGEVKMSTLSLYESGESNGSVSLSDLFNNQEQLSPQKSSLSISDMIKALCRGGWPELVKEIDPVKQQIMINQMYENICSRDLRSADGVKRNKDWADAILRSYARNICTPAQGKRIYNDALSYCDQNMSQKTFDTYQNILKNLYIIEDINAWNPNIRSKTSLIRNKKRNFVDPALAVAALGASPTSLSKDFKTLGLLFESLCIRDLKIYSSLIGGNISYFRTRGGLEVDAVIHLRDNRYGLIECKLTDEGIEEGAKHLNLVEKAIISSDEQSDENDIKLGAPAFKAIITCTSLFYKRDDGVYIIPIGCLKN